MAGLGEQGRASVEGQDRVKQEAIATVLDLLQVDEDWVQRHDDGFTWWAHEHAQRFRVEGPHQVDGRPTYWLSFETEVAKNLPADSGMLRSIVVRMNWDDATYTAAVENERLVYRSRTSFAPATMSYRSHLLAERAIAANGFANSHLERALDGVHRFVPFSEAVVPARTPHPVNGWRETPSAMLSVFRSYEENGGRPVRPERRPDLGSLKRSLEASSHTVTIGNGGTTLHADSPENGIEYTFGVDQKASHPLLGGGTSTLLSVRFKPGAAGEIWSLAQRLNDSEWTTHQPLFGLGNWAVRSRPHLRRHELAYTRFWPNSTVGPRTGEEDVAELERRLEWLIGWREELRRSLSYRNTTVELLRK